MYNENNDNNRIIINVNDDDIDTQHPLLENNPANESQNYSRLIRWLVREPFFTRLWLNSGRGAEFTRGFEFVTRILWPISLIGLLGYDFFNFYKYPDERYGDTLEKILLGTSTNQATLSANLGGYLPMDYLNYWLGINLILAAPLVGGISRAIFSKYYNQWSSPLSLTLLKHNEDDDAKAELLTKSNAYLEKLILWDKGLSATIKQAAVNEIINRVNGNRFTRPLALNTLANLVLYEQHKSNNSEIAQSALTKIKGMTNAGFGWGGLYAKYLEWSLGYSNGSFWRNAGFMAFHLLTSSMVWLTVGRFAWMLGKKLYNLHQFLHDMNQCISDHHKIWRYVYQFADYDCILLKWPIYLGDVYTSQKGFYGLTNQTLSIPIITNYLNEAMANLQYHANFHDINLVQQNISSVTDSQWQSFFKAVTETGVSSLAHMSFASLIPNLVYLQNNLVNFFTNFTQEVPVASMDFTNLGIGPHGTQTLAQSLANSSTSQLIIPDNFAGDPGASALGSVAPYSNLTIMDISRNGITDYGLINLGKGLIGSPTTTLIASDNLFTADGIIKFSPMIRDTNIEVLDLSGVHLDRNSTIALGEGIAQSKIKKLILSNTGLTNENFKLLRPYLDNVTSLDISRNNIDDAGTSDVAIWMRNDNAREISLSANPITDNGAINLADGLLDSNMEIVNVSKTRMSLPGYIEFISKLSDVPSLHTLDFSFTNLGQGAGEVFAYTVKESKDNNSTIALQRLRLAGCNLVDEDAEAIFNVLQYTKLIETNFSGNFFSSNAVIALADNVNGTQLTVVILDYNTAINDTGMMPLAAKTPYCVLQTISARGIPQITSKTAIAFAQNSVGPISEPDNLGQPDLSVNQRRQIHHAKQINFLRNLLLEGCGIDDEGALALCQIAPSTSLNIEGMLKGNPLNKLNPDTCQFSSTTRLQPTAFNMLFLTSMPLAYTVCLLALVYVFYRVISSPFQREKDRSIAFFRLPNDKPAQIGASMKSVMESDMSDKETNNTVFFKLPNEAKQQRAEINKEFNFHK